MKNKYSLMIIAFFIIASGVDAQQTFLSVTTNNGKCFILMLYNNNSDYKSVMCHDFNFTWSGNVDNYGYCTGYGKLEIYRIFENSSNCIKIFPKSVNDKSLEFQYIGNMENGKFHGEGKCGWNYLANKQAFQCLRKGNFSNGRQIDGSIIEPGSGNEINYDAKDNRFRNENAKSITGTYADGDIKEGIINYNNGDYIIGKFINAEMSISNCYYYSKSKDAYTQGAYMVNGYFYPGVKDIYSASKKIDEIITPKYNSNNRTTSDLGDLCVFIGLSVATITIVKSLFSNSTSGSNSSGNGSASGDSKSSVRADEQVISCCSNLKVGYKAYNCSPYDRLWSSNKYFLISGTIEQIAETRIKIKVTSVGDPNLVFGGENIRVGNEIWTDCYKWYYEKPKECK